MALLAPEGNDAYLNRERARTQSRVSIAVCVQTADDWSVGERWAGWGFQKVEAELVCDG